VRPSEGRIVAGVCAGLGDALGLDANVVRCGFVVLSVGGIGLLAYLIAWALMPEAPAGTTRPERRDADPITTIAFGAVVLGGLLLVRAFGFWAGDVIVWPLAAAMLGLALLAMRTADPETTAAAELPNWGVLQRLPPDAADALAVLVGTRRGALARLIAGVACIATGVLAFVITADSWHAMRSALIATTAVVVGIALVVGPGLIRLVHVLVSERQERIRADERADVAAHLHDSVLQTLALVQRRANDPKEVVRLARMQERELRAWLLAGGSAPAPDTEASLGGALEDLAAAVETERSVPVEVVRVRDCPADGLEPLLLAAREAMVNAAQHSGATAVSVYLEVEPDKATVFVRDRGDGFDLASVPADRGGISNSIVGRMTRAGGKATVRSTPGEGTEVELEMSRNSHA
jgi:signal transduction histidine kinase/phage shock protein PspC (stress-responsive transcriptional regulator)